MELESTQVRLRLTQDKAILREMRRRKTLKQDAKGDFMVIQFDGREFKFRPGATMTVSKSVGNSLRRSSGIIMGDDLTGDIVPCVEQVGTFELGEETRDEANKLTLCPVCKKDCGSLTRLARHIHVAHKSERPDLYDDTKKPQPKTDWETPIVDPKDKQEQLDEDAAVVDFGDEEEEDVNETQVAG